MVGGEYAVHMGKTLFNPVGDLGLSCHAAAQEDLLLRVAALGMGQGAQIAEDPLLRMLTDGAGVHDDHIGPLRAGHDGVAALGQIAPELLRVRLILLAAVGFHIGGGNSACLVPERGGFITIQELLPELRLGDHGGFGIHGGSPS